jgi:hypothetical protein
LRASGLDVRVDHVASCPEDDPVTCATDPYPPYRHHEEIAWLRVDPHVAVGVGGGYRAEVSVPFDLRGVSVAYTTLDGESLVEAPGGGIHHRDETLAGFGDGRAVIGRDTAIDAWTLGAAVGVTLPIGATVPDPFELTELGLPHEHLMGGSGTWDPVISVHGGRTVGHWVLLANAGARLPVYANRAGYLGPVGIEAGVGPLLRIKPKLAAFASADVAIDGPERWHGVAHGGRVAPIGTIGAAGAVGKHVAIEGAARFSPWQLELEHGDEEGTLRQPIVISVGVAWTQMPKPED